MMKNKESKVFTFRFPTNIIMNCNSVIPYELIEGTIIGSRDVNWKYKQEMNIGYLKSQMIWDGKIEMEIFDDDIIRRIEQYECEVGPAISYKDEDVELQPNGIRVFKKFDITQLSLIDIRDKAVLTREVKENYMCKKQEEKWVCGTCGKVNVEELAENEKPGLVISKNGTLLFEGCKTCYEMLKEAIEEDEG